MIDQWFKKDLQNIFEKHSIVVFIDDSGDAVFLLPTLEKNFNNTLVIYPVNSEIEELHIKHLIAIAGEASSEFLRFIQCCKVLCGIPDCLANSLWLWGVIKSIGMNILIF
jgi:hypothetical protein